MCSRYSLTLPPEAVRSYFGSANRPNFPASYNIAPTQAVAIVRLDGQGERELAFVRWGLLPSWVKDPKVFSTLINARSEEAVRKPAFRDAMRWRRCLVPADGFYEWTGPKGKKRPFFLHRPDGALFAFAGLWEEWRGPDGSVIQSAVILTAPANAVVRPLHDRMPAVLPPELFADWLDTSRVPAQVAAGFLGPAPDDLLVATEVSPKINSSKTDEPGVREPVQGELF